MLSIRSAPVANPLQEMGREPAPGQRACTGVMPCWRLSSRTDKEGFWHEITECETTPQMAM